MATRKAKKQQPTGLVASIARGRMLSGGQTWELNVFRPRVSGQRSDIKVKHLESPLDEATRLLAADGYMVPKWDTLANGHFLGEVFTA